MTRNSYAAVRRLATHPAFSLRDGHLHCPLCPERFDRVREYEDHLMAHDPGVEVAWRWLSGKRWDRERERRGWPTTDEMLARGPE
jgi:hypothetical protein